MIKYSLATLNVQLQSTHTKESVSGFEEKKSVSFAQESRDVIFLKKS
jgi:hypothetical protein